MPINKTITLDISIQRKRRDTIMSTNHHYTFHYSLIFLFQVGAKSSLISKSVFSFPTTNNNQKKAVLKFVVASN